MTKKTTASIASHLLQQKPGECGLLCRPFAAQGCSYKRPRSPVGAALCCEWGAKRPPGINQVSG
ncbi:hypothetical protein C1X72_26890 [Pseudomonas sp. FW306-2-2C-D06B]|nr:hypothetical protein C1X72_26890 [Pseudomonas sp. FW306-2-2C-D06B]PNA97283.1 hypothetical protein C1X74_15420 [Pseudomonas sp. GW460-5]PNB56420.1 hypothetical protein C1X73_19170 [Pseudomonas sp. FW305-130]